MGVFFSPPQMSSAGKLCLPAQVETRQDKPLNQTRLHLRRWQPHFKIVELDRDQFAAREQVNDNTALTTR
jgi:hypothetical protein